MRFLIFPHLQYTKCLDPYEGKVIKEENQIKYKHVNYGAYPKCEDINKEFTFSLSTFYKDIT